MQLLPPYGATPHGAISLAGLMLLVACGEGPTQSRPLPAEIRLLTPETQAGTPGWPIPDSVIVEVLDRDGNPISGVPVSWNAVNGGDRVEPAADTTNSAGRAAAEWTLGLSEGEQSLTIMTGQLDPITVHANATVLHAVSVAVGDQFACALTATNRVYCWGRNQSGQLGNGAAGDSMLVPAPVAGDLTFTAVTSSATHTCALAPDGAAYCWGSNDYGEAGIGMVSPSVPTPTPVQTTLRFTQISAEGIGFANSTCGLTSSGEAWCWGDNTFGKLGNGTTTSSAVPVRAETDVSFNSLETGYFHSCGFTITGQLWCWGEQEADPGAFGAQPAGLYTTPVVVQEDFQFSRIETGRNFTCGLTTQHAAWCWGSDWFGSLGQGQILEGSAAPLPVTGGHSFVALSSTYFEEIHALTPDGALYRWGSPGNDQVQTTPVLVKQIGFIQMDSGGYPFGIGLGACGVIAGGAVYCVRDDGHAQGVPAPVPP